MSRFAIRAVLAATDLGPSSEKVVRSAAAIAGTMGAELHLLHAFDLDALPAESSSGGSPSYPERQRQAEAALAEHARLLAPGARQGSQVVMNYAPGKAIIERAAATSADLIVIGPHRKGGISAHFLGTTAEDVLHSADVPCLMVPAPLTLPIRRVGVPTDLSEASHAAVEAALGLAGPLGRGAGSESAEIRVFHVGWNVDRIDDPGLEDHELLPAIERDVSEAVARANLQRRPPILSEVVWGVSPAATIVQHARGSEMDLLVVGTHGYGGLKRLLIGSVASGVARDAPCPVLVVPASSGAAADRTGSRPAL